MKGNASNQPTHGPLEVVLPVMGHSLGQVAHAIRSLRRQDYPVSRIVLVGQGPEDRLVQTGLHFSSQQVSTVRLPPQTMLFSEAWWKALAPHLSGTWVGVQLPGAISHGNRFQNQLDYLARNTAVPLALSNLRLADENGLLTSANINPLESPLAQRHIKTLAWGTHCFRTHLLTSHDLSTIIPAQGKAGSTAHYRFSESLGTIWLPQESLEHAELEAKVGHPFQTSIDPSFYPSIGVCIPGKNIEAFLPEALESLSRQSYVPDEVMFIDDGSTDRSGDIATASGVVTQCIPGPGRWASGARNKGIGVMTSDIIVLLDGDDVLEPDWVARVAGIFARHSDVGVMCGKYTYMDEEGNRLFTRAPEVNDWTPAGLKQRNVMAGGAGFAFRRTAFLEAGGYNEKVRIGEDWDLWQRMVNHNGLMVANAPAYRIRSRRGSALRDGAFQEAEVWGLLRVEDAPEEEKQQAYQMILIDNAKRALAFGDEKYAREATRKAIRMGGKKSLDVLPLLVASHLPKSAQSKAFELRRSIRRKIGAWLDDNLERPYGKKTEDPE